MNTSTSDMLRAPDGWVRLLRENDIETEDYLEVQYRTSYDPHTGPVLDEVLVRDPKDITGGVRRFTPEQWKEIDFPLEVAASKKS